jgi:molecular chaperone DnaK
VANVSTALGFDLGTTYSVVAQVNPQGLPLVLPNAEGSPTTPSIVLFDQDSVVVGEVAREALSVEPELVIQLVKRRMGSPWEFEYRGTSFRAEHISALILRKLKADAALLVGDIRDAVITVPAYFNDSMRFATRQAGEMAGLNVLGLLSEPTAAALAFGYDARPKDVRGIVVDLGGGTFDVTVMEYNGANLDVRSTGGDAYLGGANFDKVIFDYFVERFHHSNGLDVSDPDALSIEEFTQISQDWLVRASRTKHDLTARERTTVLLQASGLTLRLELDRPTFQSLSRVLLDEMSEKMMDVIRTGSMDVRDIDVVLAVGGSTRLPMVRERLKELLGVDPDTSVRPDEAVALGAAIFAAQQQLEQGNSLVIESKSRDYLEQLAVTDVSAHSLGIAVYDTNVSQGGRRLMQTLLSRNSPLPDTKSQTFYTMRAGETRIVIPILEGDDPDPEFCTRIGEVVIDGLAAGRPEHQPVQVTMYYDRNGILEVSALDEVSGTAVSTRIERSNSRGNTGTIDHAAEIVGAITVH